MLDMIEKKVSLKTKTGSSIVGTMHSPEKSNGKAIVVCPGFTGSADYESGFAIYAADRGYTVLAIDFYAHGDSPGKSIDLTISEELEDLRAATKFLSKKFKRLGIVGHSLGGLIACMGSDESDSIVLWAPAIQAKNVWMTIFDYVVKENLQKSPIDQIQNVGYVELRPDWHLKDSSGAPFVTGKKMWDELCDSDWKKILGGLKVPVKIIQAKKDGEPFIGFNKEAFSLIKTKKEFEMMDADHVFKGSRVKLYKSTLEWFEKTL